MTYLLVTVSVDGEYKRYICVYIYIYIYVILVLLIAPTGAVHLADLRITLQIQKKKLFCLPLKPTLLTPLHRHSSEECLPPCQSAGRSKCMVVHVRYYLYNCGNGAVNGANV